jgi:hypothetical protein
LLTVFKSFINVANRVLWRMAIILKANKINLFVFSVLFVFWYHSPNILDTPHIWNISWLRVKLVKQLLVIHTEWSPMQTCQTAWEFIFFSCDATALLGLTSPHSRSHRHITSAGILWTSGRPVSNTQQSQGTSMPLAGFEPAIPASHWPQTYALDGAATGISMIILALVINFW